MMINHVIQISYFLTFLYICSISYTKCIFKISSYECIPIFTNYINFYIQRQCYQINTHLGLLCCLDELTYLLWYFPISCNISSFMSILNNITTNAGISVYFWWVFANNTSVQSLSRVRLFATPWITARQASLSITNSRSSLRLASIESVMPSSHLILGCPLLLLPPIPPSIKVFSNESTLRMRWPKYWSFSLRTAARSTPGFPVYHQPPELVQTLAHQVGDATQPSHPLSSHSPAFSLSQHQSLFQWVNSSHEVAKVLEFQL